MLRRDVQIVPDIVAAVTSVPLVVVHVAKFRTVEELVWKVEGQSYTTMAMRNVK